MKAKVYAIFDGAAEAFLPPWTVPTEAMALRHLRTLAEREPQHDFVRFAEQYTLFYLAEFDSDTGILSDVRQEAVRNLKVLFAKTGPVVVASPEVSSAR